MFLNYYIIIELNRSGAREEPTKVKDESLAPNSLDESTASVLVTLVSTAKETGLSEGLGGVGDMMMMMMMMIMI